MKENLRKFIAFTVLVLSVILVTQITVFAADNDAGQTVTTTKTTTFLVGGTEAVSKDTNLATITFPEDVPEATISDPYNNEDTDTDPQVLGASGAEPVAKIKNTHASATYNVVLEITTWTNSVVDMEYYSLQVEATDDVQTVTADLSNASGAAKTVSTGISVASGAYLDLYLKLLLGSVSGKIGTSTLTVLGETA